MALLGLPNEILLLIVHCLDDDCDINALLQTCKQLSLLLNRYLYEHNVRHSHATALEWAAKHGYERTARQALEAGAPPGSVYEEEFKPMALACIHGHEAIVRLLLDYGVDPSPIKGWCNFDEDVDLSDSGDWGYPLLMAAHRGHESVVKLLLDRGAGANTPLEDGDTPLARAAVAGHLSIVKLLAAAGADVNRCNSDGFTILGLAVLGGNTEVIRFLIEMGAHKEDAGFDTVIPLYLAARRGNIDTLTTLLELGANPTPPMGSLKVMPLAAAADERHYTAAEFLRNAINLPGIISSGSPHDNNHKMLLLVGAACGWDDLVQRLLEQGCPPDAVTSRNDVFNCIQEENPDIPPTQNVVFFTRLYRPSALALASYRGHSHVVKTLLRHNAHYHETPGADQKPSPLYLAISANRRGVVEALLDHGASPNWQDSNGHPVLFRAVRFPGIFQLLLERGADPRLRTTQGESILARTLRSGSVETMEILRQRGLFDITPSTDTMVPGGLLGEASKGGRASVEYLLDRGYQVQPNSQEVEAALISALCRVDAPLVNLLFERGLMRGPSPIPGENSFGWVESIHRDSEAVAATMDALLAHGVDIEAEVSPFLGAIDMKMTEDIYPLWAHTYFQCLTDRGANPLREMNDKHTILSFAAGKGWKTEVKIMVKGLNSLQISLDELQRKLEHAGDRAIRKGHTDIWPILRRAYWRKKSRIEQGL